MCHLKADSCCMNASEAVPASLRCADMSSTRMAALRLNSALVCGMEGGCVGMAAPGAFRRADAG